MRALHYQLSNPYLVTGVVSVDDLRVTSK